MEFANFKVKQFILSSMLEKAAGAIGSKSDLEILKSFMFTVQRGKILCVATDTELTVLASSNAVEVLASGSIVLPAEKLLPITKQMAPEDLISIGPDGDKKAIISSISTFWTIRADSPADYPPIPDPAEVKFEFVDRAELMAALIKVSTACAVDGLRPELMVIDVTGDVIRATDGVRFHSVEMNMPFGFQLPVGAVTNLLRFLRLAVEAQIGIAEADGALLFQVDDDILIVSAVATSFPDTQNIINSVASNQRSLPIVRDSLISAINRVRINADKDTSQVELLASRDQVVIHANNKFDEVSEAILVCSWDSDPVRIVVNAGHLIDALKVHDSQSLSISVGSNETSPIAILGDRGSTAIIRQLRL